MTEYKQTPLYAAHSRLGARFVPFAGYSMPVQYSGLLDEHHAVRTAVGLFDVSHMGEIVVRGRDALSALNRVVTNDLEKIKDGKAMYTAMCYEDGGIVDDLIVYRKTSTEFFLCVNASNVDKDFNWISSHLTGDAEVENQSDFWAQIAVQGPFARKLVVDVLDGAFDWLAMPGFSFVDTHWNGSLVRAATTGYTGAGGFELYTGADNAMPLWDALMDKGQSYGVLPVGLGARDTLRLEMGYCLYGNDIDATTNPLEAGLGWVTCLTKSDFVGITALKAIQEQGVSRRLVGFEVLDKGIARHGYPIMIDGEPRGIVTSGTRSPTLKVPIGMGYVPTTHSADGASIMIDIRGKQFAARVCKMPFLTHVRGGAST